MTSPFLTIAIATPGTSQSLIASFTNESKPANACFAAATGSAFLGCWPPASSGSPEVTATGLIATIAQANRAHAARQDDRAIVPRKVMDLLLGSLEAELSVITGISGPSFLFGLAPAPFRVQPPLLRRRRRLGRPAQLGPFARSLNKLDQPLDRLTAV